jgi:hypothetical protein
VEASGTYAPTEIQRWKSDGNQMEAVYFTLLWFLHGAVIAEPGGYMLLVQVRLGNVSLHIPNSTLCKCIEGTLVQWEFQDPKMEVLYHIRPYFAGIFPYISLT